jgi:hypothetical protein
MQVRLSKFQLHITALCGVMAVDCFVERQNLLMPLFLFEVKNVFFSLQKRATCSR